MPMFGRTGLACSFCGKSAAEVSKLVAGPRVYICERCVAEAQRIMNTPDLSPPEAPQLRPSFPARLIERLRRMVSPLRRAPA